VSHCAVHSRFAAAAAAEAGSSGTAVMAIGGWSGHPVPAYYVEAGRAAAAELPDRGEVVYGHSRSAAHTREIADWVANHYQPTVIGESTVYRLT
jgi:hypothetical protein